MELYRKVKKKDAWFPEMVWFLNFFPTIPVSLGQRWGRGVRRRQSETSLGQVIADSQYIWWMNECVSLVFSRDSEVNLPGWKSTWEQELELGGAVPGNLGREDVEEIISPWKQLINRISLGEKITQGCSIVCRSWLGLPPTSRLFSILWEKTTGNWHLFYFESG